MRAECERARGLVLAHSYRVSACTYQVFEADVDYINDRNKHFNKKIDRAFGEYTKVIRENLERGTAI